MLRCMEIGLKSIVPLGRIIHKPEVLEEVKVAIGFSQRLLGVVPSRDVDEMDNQINSSGDLDKGKGFCVIVGPHVEQAKQFVSHKFVTNRRKESFILK